MRCHPSSIEPFEFLPVKACQLDQGESKPFLQGAAFMDGNGQDIRISLFFQLEVLSFSAEVLPPRSFEGADDPIGLQVRRRDHYPAFVRAAPLAITAR